MDSSSIARQNRLHLVMDTKLKPHALVPLLRGCDVLLIAKEVGFRLERCRPGAKVVIDRALNYSSYFGTTAGETGTGVGGMSTRELAPLPNSAKWVYSSRRFDSRLPSLFRDGAPGSSDPFGAEPHAG